MLERGHEEHLVEAAVREGQQPRVGDDPLDTVDVPLREVDADEVDASPEKRAEVRRFRICVADLEDATGRDEP